MNRRSLLRRLAAAALAPLVPLAGRDEERSQTPPLTTWDEPGDPRADVEAACRRAYEECGIVLSADDWAKIRPGQIVYQDADGRFHPA